MQQQPTALIIGAGIGGLAAGIGLQKAGFHVEVYERAPELREVGAGISLWANAIRALHALGLSEIVRAKSVPEIAGGFRSWNGEPLSQMSKEEMHRHLGDMSIALHRADLLAALLQAYGGALHLGAECARFEEDAGGVTAFFSDGRTARGDLLVGADGLHSVVRGQLHGKTRPTYAGYTAWRAIVPFDLDRLVPGESLGAGARFGQVPLRDGRVYWFATRNVPEGTRSPGGEKAELRRTFGGWHAPIPDLIEAADESTILRADIYDRPVLSSWGRGRVTLLGDAAHPMTPNLGQGACQALEDAVVLARCLEGAPDVPEALRAYERRRIGRANTFVRQSRQVGRMGQWEHPLAIGLRRILLRHVTPLLLPRQLQNIARVEF